MEDLLPTQCSEACVSCGYSFGGIVKGGCEAQYPVNASYVFPVCLKIEGRVRMDLGLYFESI